MLRIDIIALFWENWVVSLQYRLTDFDIIG